MRSEANNGQGVSLQERISGALCGAALGDALGAATDGLSPRQITLFYGGPVRGLETPVDVVQAAGRRAGQVTDAFSIPWLLLGEIVAAGSAMDAETARRAVSAWGESEYFEPFAGLTTRNAVRRLSHVAMDAESYLGNLGNNLFKGHYYALSTNGAALRGAPAGLLGANAERAVSAAVELARATHDDVFSISGACAMAAAVNACLEPGATVGSVADAALRGSIEGEAIARSRTDVLAYPGPSVARKLRLAARLALRAPLDHAAFLEELEALVGSGPAVAETLPAAVALFVADGGCGMDCLFDAANLGDETCAVACIAGMLCGALHGPGAFDSAMVAQVARENGFDFDQMAGELVSIRG